MSASVGDVALKSCSLASLAASNGSSAGLTGGGVAPGPSAAKVILSRSCVFRFNRSCVSANLERLVSSADVLAAIKIFPEPNDKLFTIRGIGGGETVFSRQIDYIQIGEKLVEQFEIEVGGMEDYG